MNNKIKKDGSFTSYGINNKTYDLLFKSHTYSEEPGTYEQLLAFNIIDRFTLLRDAGLLRIHKKFLYWKTCIDFSKITYNTELEQYEYNDNGLMIPFNRFSDGLVDKKLIKELQSRRRQHKCHEMSVRVAPNIENSRVVTGYITLGNRKILHSVIEYEATSNETIILDWTENLEIEKETYKRLTNFVELSFIDSENIADDLEMISAGFDFGLRPYLLFRDELIRDMKKNPNLFQSTEAGLDTTGELSECPKQKIKRNNI